MAMLVLVTYDVSTKKAAGRQRLRRVAKVCEDFGQRVQNSVFECLVDQEQWVWLRNRLLEEFKKEEDSLRFYFLGKNWRHRLEHHGVKASYDPEGPLIL